MNMTAMEMATWARSAIKGLQAKHGTYKATYAALAARSGLSESWIHKFHSGTKDNPTAQTLDRIVAAIKQEVA